MADLKDKAMDWIAEMALAGIHPEEIGKYIIGIADEDLREAVAEVHKSYTGEDLLGE